VAKPGDFDFYCEEALTGKTPIKKLYESDKVLAFYHTKPSFETHIMIIPKKHIHNLIQTKASDNGLLLEIFDVARNLASKLDIENKGARLVTNMGKFQDTPHLHFHLVSGKLIQK
jgi:histidine triad (HIT) family protein